MSIEDITNKFNQMAKQIEMPVDKRTYERAGKDHTKAILYAGNLNAKVGVLARDLGTDEVINGSPLIGAGGQILRRILTEYITGKVPPKEEKDHKDAMAHIMFTNMVPFKPISNKVFSKKIRTKFSTLVAEFLIDYWRGSYLMTLGNEAFKWFEFFCDKNILDRLWENKELRYVNSLECEIKTTINAKTKSKRLEVAPLPHPSPLNRKWFSKFPDLLRNRLVTAMPLN